MTQRYIGTELELFSRAANWKSYYASMVRPYLGRRVLEVGAGIGATAAALCDGTQDRWVCLEPDASLLRQVERKVADGELPACCVPMLGTLEDIPVEPEYDAVLYMDVLEHIADDAAEFARAAQRLRPGGVVIILVPAHQWLFSPFDAAIGHFRRYTRRTLLAAAPPQLEVEFCRYLDSVGLLASVGNRFLLRKAAPNPAQIGVWDKVLVPLSRRIDPLLSHAVGKSVLGIWRRPTVDPRRP